MVRIAGPVGVGVAVAAAVAAAAVVEAGGDDSDRLGGRRREGWQVKGRQGRRGG